MANIQAIEKSVMTTTDENMLKQMAESMPFEIYQQLSPEARQRLSRVSGGTGAVAFTMPLTKKRSYIKGFSISEGGTFRVDLTKEDIAAIEKVTQGRKAIEDWIYETIVFKLEEMGAYGKE